MSKNKREEELVKQGWEKQTTLGEPRLSEVVETYREIGFEVLLEPALPKNDETCSRCMTQDAKGLKTVFTRKKKA